MALPATGLVALPAASPTPHLVAYPIQHRALQPLHRLVSVAAWPRGGVFNDSSTVLLGADFGLTGPRLAPRFLQFLPLIKVINSIWPPL